MKMKLIATSLLLALGAVWGVQQIFAADETAMPQDLKVKYIDGWKVHETHNFKINKVNDAILVEGLTRDNGHNHTTFLRSITPQAKTRQFMLSADIRSESMDGWAGLWMRIDDQDKKPLGFDNMENRPITGTQAWKSYNVLLPVSPKAKKIVFGFLFVGKGKAWVKNVAFKPVNAQAGSTDMLNPAPLAQAPQNLEMK